MTNDRKVYLLDPKLLSPETIAVTFGKTSRSPLSFAEIAAELTDEKTHQFHEKWVVGYGHASIAEHAVLHVAVENISRLAVECLESNRLASYTEKSTRYQKWSCESFHIPQELEETSLKQVYLETCQVLFSTYEKSLPVIQAKAAALNPQKDGESDAAWERRVRTEAIDVCRFLLPASSLANVGITINARTLEHAIRKMLSHPLAEVRNAGMEMKNICQAEAPTLIKYVDPVPYLQETGPALKQEGNRLPLPANPPHDWCRLVACDAQIETRVMAAALYRFGSAPFEDYLSTVQGLSAGERAALWQVIQGRIGSHDVPLREMEYASYTFDLLLDQGGYFELKRHRMMTQSPQSLTTHLGYAVPRLIFEGGLLEQYTAAMEKAANGFNKIAAVNPDVASYVVPNAYNRRLLMQFNLRTAVHLLALRSAPNAHFSMRRVSQRMAEKIQHATPLLAGSLRICPDETWQGIEEKYFYKV